ncbi:MAG: hypothetical protein ACTH0V_05060 [Microbacteriaceae bacterium]
MTDALNLFAGPGGWDEGAADLRMLGLDSSADACATARAAGHERLERDIALLNPASFAGARGLVASPPCPSFSASGRGTGRRDIQAVLDVWTGIGWGVPAAEALASMAAVADPRTRLLAIAGAWALALDSLEWAAFEQVPAIEVEFGWEDLAAELLGAGWEAADVFRVRAHEHGAPSRRDRRFLIASRHRPVAWGAPPQNEPVSMAEALGWAPGAHDPHPRTRGQRREHVLRGRAVVVPDRLCTLLGARRRPPAHP